ncbi:MAG: tRNA (guanosine(37)-N1)-methyltransferase TrmD [Acidaminococcaceae bacterium]|nr:tRNA (guanosine(37)-N1)-methyltransferase TrmD [Acidaminococcaceae bacterium]MDD4722023.1 tRNA (guanosine(37)-N1)-methyltransferase TrmD [Acidaminococcaceae bacterium]
MEFIFITLFPELIEQACGHSIIKRAVDAGLLSVYCVNPRDFTTDKHRTVDDTPCGGGVGMVLKPEPFSAAIAVAKKRSPQGLIVALTPGGKTLCQKQVEKLAGQGQDLIFLCGHYEGFDERILEQADIKISIGDYVLTGGELPALVIMDAIARFIPGVLGKAASAEEESFSSSLLEYPQYTRPIDFEGAKVPDVLLSGNHAAIKRWRRKEGIRATYCFRPDLLAKANLEEGDGSLLLEIIEELKGKQNE